MEHNDRIIRRKEVIYMTGLSSSTLWRREKEGLFPQRISLGGNSVGWLQSEVEQWILAASGRRAA
ncbi:MAG TPA: transcriptional regulator [Flavobacteriales bacterium]|nr:transcriptional regulator [Flavobacteriales bacterium]